MIIVCFLGDQYADTNSDNIGGRAYVIYGGKNITQGNATFDLMSLDGTNGFELRGGLEKSTNQEAGYRVKGVGDLNGTTSCII